MENDWWFINMDDVELVQTLNCVSRSSQVMSLGYVSLWFSVAALVDHPVPGQCLVARSCHPHRSRTSEMSQELSLQALVPGSWLLTCQFLSERACGTVTHDGSMVLLYMVTWIPSIYPSHVSIYIPAPWIRHVFFALLRCPPEIGSNMAYHDSSAQKSPSTTKNKRCGDVNHSPKWGNAMEK